MATTLTEEDIDAIARRVIEKLGARLLSAVQPETRTVDADKRSDRPGRKLSDRLSYTLNQLCGELGVSKATVWRLESRGLIRPVPGNR